MERNDGRSSDELRPVEFRLDIAPHATGSALVCFGNTQVICCATIENRVPRWMHIQNLPGGWLTAEYSMLPYATHERKIRDISRGKIDGRSTEIQRLIGRSLRAVTDLRALGSRTLWIDCDVLQADGGTRTASITGACVAAAIAFERLVAEGVLRNSPLKQLVAAVSVGIYQDQCLLDLAYEEDRDAAVDFNLVMTEAMEYVEIQGSGEEAVFSQDEMQQMLETGRAGMHKLIELQQQTIESVREKAQETPILDLSEHFQE